MVVEGKVAEMRIDPWRRIVGWKEVVGYDLLRKGVPLWLVEKADVEGLVWDWVALGAVLNIKCTSVHAEEKGVPSIQSA